MPDNKRAIAEIQGIISSRVLQETIKEHKEYLQKEVNNFVRQRDIVGAFGALSKLEDYDNIVKLLLKKAEDLKKEEENG